MVNIIKYIMLAMLFISCINNNNKATEPAAVAVAADTLIKAKSFFEFDTTLHIKNETLLIQCIDPDPDKSDTLLISIKTDSTVIFTEYINKGVIDIQFHDFNNDSNIDLGILYASGDNALYLYDAVNNTFKKVEGFERFREPKQVKSNPNYYYSYVAAGCADLNWISKLFTIKGFETIELGYIYEYGCNNSSSEEQYMKIYSVLNNDEDNKRLLEKRQPEGPFDKWDFIDDYWANNYGKFQ